MKLIPALGCAFLVIMVAMAVQKPSTHGASQPSNNHIIAAVKWSQATCNRFEQMKEVTKCSYSTDGSSGWVSVTLAMDSADAVRLCPAFARVLPQPISNFEMLIKLAETGRVGAVCNRV
jgi:hypothetical protein